MRQALIAGALVVAVTAAAVVAARVRADRGDDARGAEQPVVATERVTSGRITTETNVVGTLLYPALRPVTAGRSGIVTWLPKVGTVLSPGDVVATIDARPSVLLRGSMPAYRRFRMGMPDGRDVQQLEANLSALGYFRGTVDGHFSRQTAVAIKAWQSALGVRPTGELDPATTAFSPVDLRVARRPSPLGAGVQPGSELLKTTARARVVRIDVASDLLRLARIGRRVVVELPDGRSARGRVVAAGAPRQRRSDTGTRIVVPTTVAVRTTRIPADLARAKVTVRLRSSVRAGLTVPVRALLALGPDRFGVEVPAGATTRRIPVRVGTYVAGRVEVSGPGIALGTRVVVPAA